MKFSKRIISYFLIFAILLSFCTPFAVAAGDENVEKIPFWEWAARTTSPAYSFYKWALDAYSGDEEPTGGGSTRGGGYGRLGYEERKKELPSNGYSSDGSILWYPTVDDFYGDNIQILEWRSGIGSAPILQVHVLVVRCVVAHARKIGPYAQMIDLVGSAHCLLPPSPV